MKMMQHNDKDRDLAFFFCPVPPGQLPINEYQHLKESTFFQWAILEGWKYILKLIAVWVGGCLFALFIINGRSTYHAINGSDFCIGALMGKLAVLFVLIRLDAAWRNVYSRLIHQKIDYQIYASRKTKIWQKQKTMGVRDCLVARFQVRPILKRLKQSILILLLFISLDLLILFITI